MVSLLLALLGSGILVTTFVVVPRARADARCAPLRAEQRARAAAVTGQGEPVLVIGDSYSASHLAPLDEAWTTRLPGRVRVDGFSGSGFSLHASRCGDQSYATRAAKSLTDDTWLVVVEGGLNDYNQPDSAIVSGFDRLVKVLHGHRVVVVGPPPAPARRAAATHVDGLLSRLTARAHLQYVSMIDQRLPYLPDHLHLTPAGHARFGVRVAGAILDPSYAG